MEYTESPLFNPLEDQPIAPGASLPAPVSLPRASPFPWDSVHLVGIGGCGMSAIARALLACGVSVSGSDTGTSSALKQLRKEGAMIFTRHEDRNVEGAEVVVVSTAIPPTNPEILTAIEQDLPVIHRSEALALLLRARESVLVTGTHGKTTTSALAGIVMEAAGLDPWAFIGGHVPQFGGNSRVGGLGPAVAEADESDGSFECLPASHLIVTNLENDHLDYWKTPRAMHAGYRRVIENVKRAGVILMCADDPALIRMARRVNREVLWYGTGTLAIHYRAANIEQKPFSTEFDLFIRDECFGRFEIGVPGVHNVTNAVAALAMAIELGGDVTQAGEALRNFHGVGRRFDVKGTTNNITVIDDYAHHPTEITATLKAAQKLKAERGGRLVVVFQPHRYSRTRDLMREFSRSFGDADLLVLTNVYPAGEKPLPRAGASLLWRRIVRGGHGNARFIPAREDIAPRLASELQPNDVVLTLGAGNVHRTAVELLDLIRIDTNWNGASPDAAL